MPKIGVTCGLMVARFSDKRMFGLHSSKVGIMSITQVGPFIKWAGGKSQLIQQFKRFMPDSLDGRGYVEPFVGGGALFFYVKQNLNPKKCTIMDINPELINVYNQIQGNVENFIDCLSTLKQEYIREGITIDEQKLFYYSVRSQHNIVDATERAARFVFLNKTCFNGLHRLNSKGEFNVPIGNYKSPEIYLPEHLRMTSKLLQGVNIIVGSYTKVTDYVEDNDFVYFDPPYEPLSRTSSFTSYTKEDFTQSDQRGLRDLAESLSNRCPIMLSNSTAEYIETLYDTEPFQKFYVSARRSINSKSARRGAINELLVTTYDVPNVTFE